MSPRDVRNLSASVRQRLFNLAKQRGDDFEAGWRRVKLCVFGITRMKATRVRHVNRRAEVALRHPPY